MQYSLGLHSNYVLEAVKPNPLFKLLSRPIIITQWNVPRSIMGPVNKWHEWSYWIHRQCCYAPPDTVVTTGACLRCVTARPAVILCRRYRHAVIVHAQQLAVWFWRQKGLKLHVFCTFWSNPLTDFNITYPITTATTSFIILCGHQSVKAKHKRFYSRTKIQRSKDPKIQKDVRDL